MTNQSLALGSLAASRIGCSFMARPMEPWSFSLRMKKACCAPSLPLTLQNFGGQGKSSGSRDEYLIRYPLAASALTMPLEG